MDTFIWIGIIICVSQSAMFSGLNLAFFSISKLRLELEMSKNNPQAFPIAKLREDSNFLLSTILWGNVGVNVLLTLLSGSVLAGVAAFLFSTFVITIAGEIIPQSYLSRNAMKAASVLAPAIRFYQVLLFPLAKPTAIILNKWLGKEAMQYIPEDDIIALVKLQMEKHEETKLSKIESQGMINIMNFDKVSLSNIGNVIEPINILKIARLNDQLMLPEAPSSEFDAFINNLKATTKQWTILVDETDAPHYVLDSHAVLKDLYKEKNLKLFDYCVKPLIFHSGENSLLDVLEAIYKWKTEPHEKSPIVVIFWKEEQRRIITNTDVLELIAKDMFVSS